MKRRLSRGIMTLLFLCVVLSAFYMRESTQPQYMEIPVTQVLTYVTPASTQTPAQAYRQEREQQRQKETEVLSQLIQSGDETAKAYLETLMQRMESELAVENMLKGLGYESAVCAVREGAVMICVGKVLDEKTAQTIIELSEKITGECVENVFILDENGYS